MQKIKKLFITLIFSTAPISVLADPLVTCDTGCGWVQLMDMVNRVIKFILFDMAIPIAAIMFAYGGFLMISSGGSPESRTKAKSILTNALLGLVLAAGAWIIIRTILSILGYEGTWIGFTPFAIQ